MPGATIAKNERSKIVYEQLKQVMPGGVSSPIRSHRHVHTEPLVVASAHADTLTDVDGNEYVDFWSACGALIAGHAHPHVVDSVQKQIKKGTSYGCTTPLEGKLAGMICKAVPNCSQIRFCASGTEATMTAVRLARKITGKKTFIQFQGCYHGHADLFMDADASCCILPFNDVQAVEKIFAERSDIACVIVEPIAGNMGVVHPDVNFLQLLREKTEQAKALLIFDEVITAFRVAGNSCQALYGIEADITTFGKIVGGGYPLAAVGGKRQYMQHISPAGDLYHAGTHSGNPVSVTGGIATLELLQERNFYADLDAKTDLLVQPIEQFLQENEINACIQRQNSMFTLFFGTKKVSSYADFCQCDKDRYARFFAHMFENGYFIPAAQGEAWFVTAAHTEDHLINAAKCAIDFLI